MHIVILDGKASNPGDLTWDALRNFGDLTVYAQTLQDDVVLRAAEAEVLITNKVCFNADLFSQLPCLRYIGILATGYNNVDIAAAERCGVTVTNVPGYSSDSVAQLTFAHILNLTFSVAVHTNSVRDGDWCRNDMFCYWLTPLTELAGLTLGLVGFGAIARKVAAIAEAFGMNVIAYTPRLAVGSEPLPNVRAVTLETLLTTSDIVSLHCPLTDENRELINAGRLAKMKPTSLLINTARGMLVNEPDLANALTSGKIAGAGLDVLASEPPQHDCPLIGLKNCFITPHIAWGTLAARQRLLQVAVDNLAAFLNGEQKNVVTKKIVR
ncbi:MAG: D-2-hydroxyacid dehydrogenase [Planctomycetaceae bacterium]|jgi:glycerate dehydrogenase|nr:D-2-hydroxyacid dehydrogenase [Planctomycetaceae bacterium]